MKPTPENIEAAIAAYESATLAMEAAILDSRPVWGEHYRARTISYRAEAAGLFTGDGWTQTAAESAAFWHREGALAAANAKVEACRRDIEWTEGDVRRLLAALAASTPTEPA